MSFPRYESYKDWEDPVASIPSHWAVSKLHRLATINDDTLPEDIDPAREIEYVDIGSVSLGRGIHQTQQFAFSSAPSRARRLVREGDIIVSTVRTYLKAIAPIGQGQDHLVVSTGFAVVRPTAVLASGFAKYALQSPKFVDDVISRSTGVSYPAINASDLARIDVPTPPTEEQVAIAAFLDRETAKIDALIAEQERLLEVLAEKRQAVISHAVTKGLNPDAPMKDSGVAWLGEVPAHWDVARVRYSLVIDNGRRLPINREERAGFPGPYPYWGPTGIVDHIDHFRYEGERALIGEDGDHFTKHATWPMTQWAAGRFNVNNHAHVIADGSQCSARWFYYSFLHRDIGADLLAQGVSRLKLSREALSNLWLAIPPKEEQFEIISRLDGVVKHHASLVVLVRSQIDLLLERRSALIAAAVTGQIDVREAA